jgi:tRNA (mo5U34)-methyltransferase
VKNWSTTCFNLLHNDTSELMKTIEKLGPWMYKFELGDNIYTNIAIDELQEIHDTRKKIIFTELDKIFCNDYSTMTGLDIACNEGFFSFELLKRNLKKMVAFDAREINIEKANFLKNHLGFSNVEFFVSNIDDVEQERMGKFDLVFLLGLLYHVENPMSVLRKVREFTRKLCVIDTQIIPSNDAVKMGWGLKGKTQETSSIIGLVEEKSYEKNIAGSVTGLSFVPNKAALLLMLKYAGFSDVKIMSPPADSHEQYLNHDRVIIFAR